MVANTSLRMNKLQSWPEVTKNAKVQLRQKMVPHVAVSEKDQLYEQIDTVRIMWR